MQNIQDEYLIAVGMYADSLTDMTTALKKHSDTQLTSSYENLLVAQDYWNYAFALLHLVADVPVGTDGTLTSDDLKDSDRLAGYDRDTVLTSISKDGKELIGKWGNQAEDGSIDIALILNADGTYDGYGIGAYPSQENALIGTWKYDYIKRVLVINNEKMFTAGIEKTLEGAQYV